MCKQCSTQNRAIKIYKFVIFILLLVVVLLNYRLIKDYTKSLLFQYEVNEFYNEMERNHSLEIPYNIKSVEFKEKVK